MAGRKLLNPEDRKGYSGKKLPPFCKNVREKRLEIGLSLKQLADLSGINVPRISELESGIMTTNNDRIIALADALDVDLNWLFGREWPKQEDKGTDNE